MSDPMQMQGAPATPRPNAITDNMSVFNPSDAGMMKQTGQIQKGMTVQQLIENVLKVPLNAPATSLVGAMKAHLANRNMAGKAPAMAASAPSAQGQPPASAPMPPQGQAPEPAGDRMSTLMSAMKGGR